MTKHQPSLMILLEGGNDILRSVNLNQTKHNLSQTIELANSKDVQVMFLGVPKKGVFLRTADFISNWMMNTNWFLQKT